MIDHLWTQNCQLDKKLIFCHSFGWYHCFFALTKYFMCLMYQHPCYKFSHWNVMKGSFMKAPPFAAKNCLFRGRSSWPVMLHLFRPSLKRDNFAFKRNKWLLHKVQSFCNLPFPQTWLKMDEIKWNPMNLDDIVYVGVVNIDEIGWIAKAKKANWSNSSWCFVFGNVCYSILWWKQSQLKSNLPCFACSIFFS